MEPAIGTIHFSVKPENAELYINDKPQGPVPPSLSLPSAPQKLKIVKEGYEPYQTEITPQPGVAKEINVTLLKKIPAPAAAGSAASIKAANGYPLLLVRPSSFTMGSSRQEQVAVPTKHSARLCSTGRFIWASREVTNGEFRKYLSSHDSGYVKDYSLNQDGQPVVNVTWEQAALFCNWLSEKEKLPPAYSQQGGRLISPAPLPPATGFRQRQNGNTARVSHWTDATPFIPGAPPFRPPLKRLTSLISLPRVCCRATLTTMRTAIPVSAPPATFAAGALGLYDLAGNVAEWCHDYYSLYPYNPGQRYQDPSGAQEGKHHLVRGSSWKHSSISDVRSAFRDYSSEKRPDVGFRICRYAD